MRTTMPEGMGFLQIKRPAKSSTKASPNTLSSWMGEGEHSAWASFLFGYDDDGSVHSYATNDLEVTYNGGN